MEKSLNIPPGQTLVELAIVLPLFLFVLAVCVEGFVLCHNAILLQEITGKAARQAALETGDKSLSIATLLGTAHLVGQTTLPFVHRNTELLQPWRRFHGDAVTQTSGRLVTVDISSTFIGHGFLGWGIPWIHQRFRAQFPQEPEVPGEG